MATDPTALADANQPNDVDQSQAAPAADKINPLDFYAEPAAASDQPPADPAPDDALEPEPIARPHSWNNDQEDMWKSLPREVQEVMAAREVERERFVHTKAQEAARVKQSVEAETRQGLIQLQQHHAQQLQQAMQMINMPEPPDQRLLASEDPEHHRLYMVQQNRYNAATDQAATLHRSAEMARQQAEHLQSQERQLAIQADEAKLVEMWPDWSEPSKRAERLAQLAPIAAELGYGPEEQANAASTDLFALHKAMEWKRDAEKYRAMMKQRMEPVRAAKQAPPASRATPALNGNRQPADVSAILYPNDQPRH